MKYLMLLLFVSSFLFFACSSETNQEKSQKLGISTAKITILDSIQIPLDSSIINDYNFDLFCENILLGIDSQDQIYGFDLTSKKSWKFSKKGTAPGEYLLPVGISILNKDSVFVLDRQLYRLTLYDLKGKTINTWSIHKLDTENEPAVFYTFSNVFKDKNELHLEYTARSKKYEMADPHYYKNTKLLSIVNLQNSKTKYAIPYETTSPYLGDKYLLSPFDPYIAYNKNYYAVVLPHDPYIYIYDRQKKLVRTITDIPYKFPPKPEGVSFRDKDKNFSRDYVKFNIKKNALNKGLVFCTKEPELMLRQYVLPITTDIPDDMNYWRVNYHKQNHFLQAVTTEGKVIEEAIELPDILGKIVYAESLQKIYFLPNSKKYEKNIIYICKVQN